MLPESRGRVNAWLGRLSKEVRIEAPFAHLL
jgi:hypothetical protein